MNVSNGLISLSTGVVNGIGNSISTGSSSLINVILTFFPYMLTITVVFFVLRFIFRMARLKSPSASSNRSFYGSYPDYRDYSRTWKSYKSSLDYRNRYGLRHYFDKGWYAKKS